MLVGNGVSVGVGEFVGVRVGVNVDVGVGVLVGIGVSVDLLMFPWEISTTFNGENAKVIVGLLNHKTLQMKPA